MARAIVFDILARDRASSTFSKVGKAAGALGGILGVGAMAAFTKTAITAQAEFGQTLNTLQAATGATAAEIAQLDALAIKLGKDTAFSAGEAAGAMLELGKAGISTKEIMGGGVAGTLTLAAAGGTDLATASTIASNAMNAFNLEGKDMARVAAALAGGANASSASVESLGEGLRQVGPGAVNAGLSLRETVGALSAFDAAGLKGSDGGTSLKTMLARLVPQTERAANAMDDLGLSFVKPNGEFKNLGGIAQQLQDKLGGLSEAERVRALNTIFGSDASRAASVLMKEGAAGVQKYTKATSDLGAAEEMAAARMKGSAGTIERLKGSFETAALVLGKKLEPGFMKVGGQVADNMVPAMEGLIRVGGQVVGWVDDNSTALIALAATIGTVTAVTKIHAAVLTVQAAGGLLKYLAATKLVSATTAAWTAVQWAINVALTANPIGLVVVGLGLLVGGLILAYKKSETFRNVVSAALDAVGAAGRFLWNNIYGPILKLFIKTLGQVMVTFGKMLQVIGRVPGFGWVGDLGDKLVGAGKKADELSRRIKDIPSKQSVTIDVSVTGRESIRAAEEEIRRLKAAGGGGGTVNSSGGDPGNQAYRRTGATG